MYETTHTQALPGESLVIHTHTHTLQGESLCNVDTRLSPGSGCVCCNYETHSRERLCESCNYETLTGTAPWRESVCNPHNTTQPLPGERESCVWITHTTLPGAVVCVVIYTHTTAPWRESCNPHRHSPGSG